MKWMRERDHLIAQTMAFVQSVTGKRPDAEKPPAAAANRPAAPAMPDIEAMLAETIASAEPPKLIQPGRPTGRSEYQNEIQARVAISRPPAALPPGARGILQRDHGQGSGVARQGGPAAAARQIANASEWGETHLAFLPRLKASVR
jgi:hypothetical protein